MTKKKARGLAKQTLIIALTTIITTVVLFFIAPFLSVIFTFIATNSFAYYLLIGLLVVGIIAYELIQVGMSDRNKKP